MSESKLRIKKAGSKDSVSFKGALKSKNEIYFQMASVFKMVSGDETGMAGQVLYRILASAHPEMPGKLFPNSI